MLQPSEAAVSAQIQKYSMTNSCFARTIDYIILPLQPGAEKQSLFKQFFLGFEF